MVAVVGPGAGVGSIGSVYLELDNHPKLQAGFTSTQLIERVSFPTCFLYRPVRIVRHWTLGGISF